MLRYWNDCKFMCDEVIYSCDMVRLSVVYREDCIQTLRNLFCKVDRSDVKIWNKSFKEFAYTQLVSIDVADSTVAVGIGLNGCNREDRLKGFIEFNPNKVFPEWYTEFKIILGYCYKVEIKRIDIALDIPIARNLLALKKDNRISTNVYKSEENRTEYLGVKNTPGYVKLYNKKVESKLDQELTRLEITTEADMMKFVTHIPKVYIDGDFDDLCYRDESASGLSKSDIVIIDMLMQFDIQKRVEYLHRFAQVKRKKIEPYVLANKEFKIDLMHIAMLIDFIQTMCIV